MELVGNYADILDTNHDLVDECDDILDDNCNLMKQKKELVDKYDDLADINGDLEMLKDELIANLAGVCDDLNDLQDVNYDLEKQKEDLIANLSNTCDDLFHLQADHDEANLTIKLITEEVDVLTKINTEAADDICSLKDDLEHSYNEINEISCENGGLDLEITDLKRDNDDLKKKNEALQLLVDNFGTIVTQIRDDIIETNRDICSRTSVSAVPVNTTAARTNPVDAQRHNAYGNMLTELQNKFDASGEEDDVGSSDSEDEYSEDEYSDSEDSDGSSEYSDMPKLELIDIPPVLPTYPTLVTYNSIRASIKKDIAKKAVQLTGFDCYVRDLRQVGWHVGRDTVEDMSAAWEKDFESTRNYYRDMARTERQNNLVDYSDTSDESDTF